MSYIKSYTLTPEQQENVDKTLAEYKEKSKSFSDVVMVSEPSPLALEIFDCADCEKADVWCDKHTRAVVKASRAKK